MKLSTPIRSVRKNSTLARQGSLLFQDKTFWLEQNKDTLIRMYVEERMSIGDITNTMLKLPETQKQGWRSLSYDISKFLKANGVKIRVGRYVQLTCTICKSPFHIRVSTGKKLVNVCFTCAPYDGSPKWRGIAQAYGMSKVQYEQMLENQHDSCALCLREFDDKKKRPVLDHDHQTGRPRGLVCIPCNSALAYIDNKEWLERALQHVNPLHKIEAA